MGVVRGRSAMRMRPDVTKFLDPGLLFRSVRPPDYPL